MDKVFDEVFEVSSMRVLLQHATATSSKQQSDAKLMPSDRAHAKAGRRRRTRTRRDAAGVPASIVRFGIGAWTVSLEELTRRLAVAAGDSATGPHRSGRRADNPYLTTIGWTIAGLAVESAEAAGWIVATLAGGGRRSVAIWGSIGKLPFAGMAAGPLRPPIRRWRSYTGALRDRGRVETIEAKRMFRRLVRETASQSVRDIADSAIKEVAHSPEVAQLVRSQSASVATGTILEVRANSEQADERIERRVRSWLHIIRPEDENERTQPKPSSPPQTVA